MSAIAAVFFRQGLSVEDDQIRMMLAAIPYRGPDGTATHVSGPVGVGHAKMAVTPEEDGERQPLISTRTGCVLAADVRLDNRSDLLARLSTHPALETSDAQLILLAYEEWGVDAVNQLLGDFAFILWDPRQQRLVCARDTSGQRALFYRVNEAIFAAASEIHQLFQDPGVPIRPNEERIRERLVPQNMYRNEKDSAQTYFEGIRSLRAGHVLVVNPESVRETQYWQLPPVRELRYRTNDEYAEHFRDLFFKIMRPRLRSAGRLGALLSGGLDSSAIVCVAQQLIGAGQMENPGFSAFSSVFPGLDCDEELLIRDIESLYAMRVRYVPATDPSDRSNLHTSGFIESPNMGSRTLRDTIGLAAMEEGVRVVLSGDVADSCVGGSRLVFDSLLRHWNLQTLRQHLRAYRRVSDESLPTVLWFTCTVPLLPMWAQRGFYQRYARREYRRQGSQWLPTWMCEPLRRDLSRRHVDLWTVDERNRRFSSPARHLEYSLLYPPELVRQPVPWPLEVWRPFADRRLHEFLLAVPPEQKFEPHPETDEFYAGSKQLVRRAMRGIVPDKIRTRPSKTVFQNHTTSEISLHWSDYAAAFGPGGKPEIALRGYVDQSAFWSRLIQLREGLHGTDLVYVLATIGLETWLRSLQQPRKSLVAGPVASSGSAGVVHRSSI